MGQLAAHPELAERMLYDGFALNQAYPILPTSAELAEMMAVFRAFPI
jgi:hypothetical protein